MEAGAPRRPRGGAAGAARRRGRRAAGGGGSAGAHHRRRHQQRGGRGVRAVRRRQRHPPDLLPNGRYRAWEQNAALLRPLVDSGQVALGNHTWSHPDLTTLGDAEVAEEIRRNRDFLRSTFGVQTPFFRPPFGARDERTDRIAADLGHPTIALWNGTFEDNRVLTGEELLAAARRWFSARTIVVGHANHPTVTAVYGQLLELIAERGLTTVTLADVWSTRR
ncbi:polysaccharide deacetylase family protein [Blastococcus sp. KM273128]|uniref:polysaccharide deacetylase family protein n=1 Tax=Blastococcus sp. KM273128 TaxID=2570314 RepID=UPI002103AAF4|nr:polysaccharide deacetylase family protein [Blastococcus sp. KM273128]